MNSNISILFIVYVHQNNIKDGTTLVAIAPPVVVTVMNCITEFVCVIQHPPM